MGYFKNLNIRVKILSIVIITIIVLGTIISVKSIYSIMTLTKENIEDYKVNAYSQKENELRSYVKMAQKVVKDFYEKQKRENSIYSRK